MYLKFESNNKIKFKKYNTYKYECILLCIYKTFQFNKIYCY